MDLFDLVAKITLDSSQFVQGLKEAQGKASGFGSTLKTAAKVGAAAIGAATTAVAGFTAASIKVGANFDASMSQVAATMGLTVDQIGELRDFAQEMGATTVFSATQAADALNYMALAGYTADESMEALPNVLNLAAAGNIDLARASDMVTDAQSALGLTMEQSTALVDQMAKASSKSNTSVEQLGDAILTVGGTAQYMSGGTEELATVLGVLADNGIKGAEGGTHLRNMLLSLSAPTEDAQKQLDALGVNIFDAEGNMRSFADIFPELNAAMSNLTDQQKLDAFSAIFNTRDIASATALLNTTKDRWNELGDAIEDSQGSAEKMAQTQLDNLAGDITLFKSALEGAQIAISDGLTPTLRDFVQFGSDGLSKVTQAMKEDGVAGAMDALGTVLSDGLAMITDRLPDMVDAGISLLSSLGKGIINALPKLADASIKIVMKLVDTLIDSLPRLIPAAVQIIMTLVTKLTEPTMIMELIQAAFQIIGAVAQGLIDAIPAIVAAAPTIILNLIEALLRFLPQLLSSGLQLISEFALGIIRGGVNVVKGVTDVLQNASKLFKERIANAKKWGAELINNFINGLKEKWEALKGSVSNVGKAIAGIFKHSVPRSGPFKRDDLWGAHMIQNFTDGLLSKAPELIRAATTTADSVADAMQFSGDMAVSSSYSPYAMNSYNGAQSQGVAIYGDVHISIDGTGQNAEQIGREFYKQLVGLGVAAYAY